MLKLNSHPSGRHFLQIPGPTNVPDRILRAMDYPTIDHRGPEFQQLGKKILGEIGQIFQTTQPVVIYPASGTGAWEAALVNTLSPGDTVLMYETGHFATLWKKLAERLSCAPNSSATTGAAAPTRPASKRACWKTRATRSRPCAWCTTRPRPASPPTSPRCAAPSTRPATRRCCWSTRFPRSARSITATTNGAWTSPWPARRRA
jgi:hypothetical protein